jgi:hypothetical protein
VGAAASGGGLFGKVTISAAITAACSAADIAAAQARAFRASAARRRGTSGMRRRRDGSPGAGLRVGIRRGLIMLSYVGLTQRGASHSTVLTEG